MRDKGGLPPISRYLIQRRHYLDQNLWVRAFKRVNAVWPGGAAKTIKNNQRELCNLRKEKYK